MYCLRLSLLCLHTQCSKHEIFFLQLLMMDLFSWEYYCQFFHNSPYVLYGLINALTLLRCVRLICDCACVCVSVTRANCFRCWCRAAVRRRWNKCARMTACRHFSPSSKCVLACTLVPFPFGNAAPPPPPRTSEPAFTFQVQIPIL